MKKSFCLFGNSGVWALMFSGIVLFEMIAGTTIKGMFYSFVFMLGYFLCRIADALENMSAQSRAEQGDYEN